MTTPPTVPKPRSTREPLRLIDALKALPPRTFDALVKSARVKIDSNKRIDAPSQVARAIVTQSLAKDASSLGAAANELLCRVAASGGLLVTAELAAHSEGLVESGLLFVQPIEGCYELWIPSPILLQLKPWLGEDLHGMRALFARTTQEAIAAIASHYLGHTAQAPYALSLEAAWAVLGSREMLLHHVGELPRSEHALLLAVERMGGEVDTLELLELEREPLRMRTATGASASRRGLSYSLERRGLLFALPHGRHAIPTEVADIVAFEERQARKAGRRAAVAKLESHEELPRRARYASDPSPFLAACLLATREAQIEVRAEIGTPKTLVARLATRFGRTPEDASLIIAVGRSLGLWDDALLRARPDGLRMGQLGKLLFEAWRTGTFWDEARSDRELLRHQPEMRELSPLRELKRVLLAILEELGAERWLPFGTLTAYISSLNELQMVRHLLTRWSMRIGASPGHDVTLDPIDLVSRIVLETLPALGVVDVGRAELDDAPLVRLSTLGRGWLRGDKGASETSSYFTDEALHIGSDAKLLSVLALAGAVEIGSVEGQLTLHVSRHTLGNAIAAGADSRLLEKRIAEVAPLPDNLREVLASAGRVVGTAQWVAACGFLWVVDENVRSLLLERRQTAELFVHPSPQGGLLVTEGVDRDKLVRRCRIAGIEIETSEGRVTARAKR